MLIVVVVPFQILLHLVEHFLAYQRLLYSLNPFPLPEIPMLDVAEVERITEDFA